MSVIRDEAILETFYATGIRTAELANLNIGHIDFPRGLLTVSKGKGWKDRVLPIAERALTAIDKYLLDCRPHLSNLDSDNALYLSNKGKRYNPNKLSRLVTQYIQRAGVEKIGSCRKFRHATATLMLENGADIRIIQEMMGHEDISTTQIYAHVSPEVLMKTYGRTHPASFGQNI